MSLYRDYSLGSGSDRAGQVDDSVRRQIFVYFWHVGPSGGYGRRRKHFRCFAQLTGRHQNNKVDGLARRTCGNSTDSVGMCMSDNFHIQDIVEDYSPSSNSSRSGKVNHIDDGGNIRDYKAL